MTATKSETRFQRWYRLHKKAVNKRRRQKYHADPDYREKQISRVSAKYWDKRPRIVLKNLKKKVAASFTHNGNPAYGLPDVATLFSRRHRTIRFWIESLVLPKPLYVADQRKNILVYTEQEFELIRKHGQLLGYPKKVLSSSVFAKTLRRDMAYLRRGYLQGE